MEPLTIAHMPSLIASFSSYLRDECMVSLGTQKRYVGTVQSFDAFLAAHPGQSALPIEEVGKALIAQFLREQASQTGTPSRNVWNMRLSALRSFYDHLFKQEKIKVNPARRVDRKKLKSKKRVPLSLDEMIRLVDAAAEHSPPASRTRNVAILQVFFHCSIRVAELVSLSLDQLDFDNHLLLDVRAKGDVRLAVSFNDVVAEAIGSYLEDRKRFDVADDELALFISEHKKRISVRAVQNLVKRYGELAGISRGVTPHLLRHSSVTKLVEMGTPLRVVQDVVGHSSVTTTEHYAHVSDGQRRRAVDKLGVAWKQRTTELTHAT